jgi:serine/threonine-protein kinase
MVGSYGEVYLVDWGIATPLDGPSSTEGIAGTPAYMAPEMFFGASLDMRTDVYLLGATLHEVLTGRSRHDGKDIMQVLQSVAASKPVTYDASVPEPLGALCNAATARDRAARPQDVRAFRDQVAEFLQGRSALALSDAASERLSRLTTLLAGAAAQEAPSDLAAAYQLATEARFGFVQSLREQPKNAAASAGLRASILALVELEIRQKHADTAEALLREVEAPDPTLSARIAAVRADDETRRREAQRLEAIDHDLDPTVEAAPRALLVAMMVVLVATITIVAITSAGGITPRKAVTFGGIFTGAVILGTFVFRRRLTSNAFNRKLSGLMVGIAVLVEVERIIAYASDVSVERIFATDLWISAAGVGAAAITLRSRLWVGVVPTLLGAVLATRFPDWAPNVFSGSMIATFVLLGFVLRPTARKAERRARGRVV